MARERSEKATMFCLTGVKKNGTDPVSRKHVQFTERQPQTFTQTKQIHTPLLECALREDLNDTSRSFLDNTMERKRVRPNLKKILNIWESWSRKRSNSASQLRRPDRVKVNQPCKSETDLVENLYGFEGCHNDHLEHVSDQPHHSDQNDDDSEFVRPLNHKENYIQEKIKSIPDVRGRREGNSKQSNWVALNRTRVATNPAHQNLQYLHESGPSSGRKDLDVTRRNDIGDIKHGSKLTEVKKLSPKAMMLRGILNRIRTAGTENVIELTGTEQQGENSDGNNERKKQKPETEDDLGEFLSGVDGQGLEQFFSFCDKILLTESRRYSCMTASEFAARRKKNIDISHKQGNATVQGLASVHLNSNTSAKPDREFATKNPKPRLSSSILSTDESSLEFEAPLSSTPVIADSVRGRLYNPHISSIYIDPDTTDTEPNDIGQSFDVQPPSACVDLSSSEFWRSDYVPLPKANYRDCFPKNSNCDQKSAHDLRKTDFDFSKPSQIRRQTKDFVRNSTSVQNSRDVRTEQKRNSYNCSRKTCDVKQRSTDEERRRPVSDVFPAMRLGESSAEGYKDWDHLRYPIHDNDSGCGHSMNSESVFLGNI